MANHIHTHVNFHRINDAGKKVLAKLYSRVRQDQDYEWFSDIFVDGKEGSPTYEEAGQYSFTVDAVGPKWCYFEEFGEDYFTMESAWSLPVTGVEWIFEKVSQVDSDFIAYVVYEDEMPNFAGAYVYKGGEIEDGLENDSEEIRDLVILSVVGLADEWDEEEEEFTDEGQDMFSDTVWEVIGDYQMRIINEIIEMIEQDEQSEILL